MTAPLILIAAGGAGSRLGGNKLLVRLAGRRLIDHVLDFAHRQGGPVAVAANAPLPGVLVPQLADHVPGLGPIGALQAGFAEAARLGRDQLLMIGCDLPFLPDDLLPRLAAALPGQGATLPLREGRLHPMASLWRVDPPALAAFVAAGGRALHSFARAQGMVTVEWNPTGNDPFANINTPDDLAAAEARLT